MNRRPRYLRARWINAHVGLVRRVVPDHDPRVRAMEEALHRARMVVWSTFSAPLLPVRC